MSRGTGSKSQRARSGVLAHPASPSGPEPFPPSGPFRPFDPRAPYLVPVLTLLATRLWMARAVHAANEDAYITFRYAANWASGMGPVFNPGERVLGFSSPLWTTLLAVGLKLGADPVVWSRVLAIAGDLALLLALGTLLERGVTRTAAWMFGMFWAGYPFFAAVTVSGLETGFVVSLLAVAGWCIARRHAASGPLLGALALSRPEGFVMAAVLALWARPRDRIVAGAIALVGIASLSLYFGSPLPQSMLAKASLYGTPGPWAGRHWWEWMLPVLLQADPTSSEGGNLRIVSVVLFAGAVAGLPALWRMRSQPLAGVAAALLVVWLGYSALGVVYFYWYMAFPVAAAALLAAVGLARASRGPVIPAAFILSVVGMWSIAPLLYVGRAENEANVSLIMSGFIERQGKTGQSLLLEPIGLIGWRNRSLVVLDEVGLVSPAIAKRRTEGPGWYADIVRQREPSWLLSRRAVLVKNAAFAGAGTPFRSLGERDSLLADYRVAAAQDTLLGDKAWIIYQRKGAP